MKKNRLLTGAVLAAALAMSACGGSGDSSSGAGQAQASLTAEARQALTEALTGRQGEYAAYATYSGIIGRYGNVEPYLSIRRAESRHADALKRTMDRYGVSYPGQNPYLGRIAVPDSLVEAARAGERAEINNIQLYDDQLAAVRRYPDITRVFRNLQSASLNRHLTLFRAAARSGGTLTAEQMRQTR